MNNCQTISSKGSLASEKEKGGRFDADSDDDSDSDIESDIDDVDIDNYIEDVDAKLGKFWRRRERKKNRRRACFQNIRFCPTESRKSGTVEWRRIVQLLQQQKRAAFQVVVKKVRDPLKKVDHRQLPQHFISMFFLALPRPRFGLVWQKYEIVQKLEMNPGRSEEDPRRRWASASSAASSTSVWEVSEVCRAAKRVEKLSEGAWEWERRREEGGRERDL